MKNIKCVIIDGWNLFSYDGIPTDTEDKKTIAVKQFDDLSAEVFLITKTMTFEVVVEKGIFSEGYKCNRFSRCLEIAEEWFEDMMEDKENE